MNSIKDVFFRADGNSIAGLGHIYRVISLMNMLKDTYTCTLITNRDTPIQKIGEVGINVQVIPDNVQIMEEPIWFKKIAPRNSIFFVDGYKFCNEYFERMKAFKYKVVYVDDHPKHYENVDAIINHNPAVGKNDYDVSSQTRLYLGAKYTMLRPKFLEEARVKNADPKLRTDSVFVCFGGSDEKDLSYEISLKLLMLDCVGSILVVLGASNSKSKIHELEGNSKLRIYNNLKDGELLKVMRHSDIAIVPASTILFEVCAVKMPVITTVTASNQEQTFDFFVGNGLAYGIHEAIDVPRILNCNLLVDIYNEAAQYINMQQAVIDGKSKERIIQIVKSLNHGN